MRLKIYAGKIRIEDPDGGRPVTRNISGGELIVELDKSFLLSEIKKTLAKTSRKLTPEEMARNKIREASDNFNTPPKIKKFGNDKYTGTLGNKSKIPI